MKIKLSSCVIYLTIVLAIALAGCATKPRVNWDSRVGTYTYDEAVIELGPPNRQSDLSDGRKVAEWVTGYSGGSSVSIGFGSFGRHTGVGVSQTVGSGGYERLLRLTFGADGRLTEWRRN